MNFYKDRNSGKIYREDDARELCDGKTFYNRFTPLQGDELTRAVIDDVIVTHGPADSYKYMLLDRLRQDCGYYLDGGNRNSKYLWGGSVPAHLDAMRRLYESFPEGSRPEWLTMAQIDDYAERMEREPTGRRKAVSPAVGTL